MKLMKFQDKIVKKLNKEAIRKWVDWKDGTLCDRDKNYLERYFEMYDLEIVEAKYSIEFELEGINGLYKIIN